MRTPEIVLIHGNGGLSSDDVWFPSTKRRLEALGLSVVAPTMPDNNRARSNVWLPYMQDVLQIDENSIVIGHSSGAAATMRYAESRRILGSVLVGASYTDLGISLERSSGYFDRPWDWTSIRRNQKWIVQFASSDDPFIPIEEPRHIHAELDTHYHEQSDRGHFMDCNFPELVAVVAKLALRQPLPDTAMRS